MLASLVLIACDRAPSAGGPAANATQLTGWVREQVDAPPYTYLRLETGSGEQWAAVPVTRVDKERPVKVTGAVPLRDFEIAPGRRVEVLYLGSLAQ